MDPSILFWDSWQRMGPSILFGNSSFIRCQSAANPLPIRCQSVANIRCQYPLLISYLSAANYLCDRPETGFLVCIPQITSDIHNRNPVSRLFI
jgi:hypothetical protein